MNTRYKTALEFAIDVIATTLYSAIVVGFYLLGSIVVVVMSLALAGMLFGVSLSPSVLDRFFFPGGDLFVVPCVCVVAVFLGVYGDTFQKRRTTRESAVRVTRKWAYPSDWNEVRQMVLARDRFQCGNCGSLQYLHIHHIVPLSVGGSNEPGNLRTLCRQCHSRLHPHMRDAIDARDMLGPHIGLSRVAPPDIEQQKAAGPKTPKGVNISDSLAPSIQLYETGLIERDRDSDITSNPQIRNAHSTQRGLAQRTENSTLPSLANDPDDSFVDRIRGHAGQQYPTLRKYMEEHGWQEEGYNGWKQHMRAHRAGTALLDELNKAYME